MSESAYERWRARVHERVCVPARSCTCPGDATPEVMAEAREAAEHVHAKYEHPGTVRDCQSPHDVICKAVWA